MNGPEQPRNPWGKGETYQNQIEVERQIESFYNILENAGELSFTFRVHPGTGMIDVNAQTVNIASMALLPLARELQSASTKSVDTISSEDVRLAARYITERHPDARFDFPEDRTKNIFEYRAWVERAQSGKNPWGHE